MTHHEHSEKATGDEPRGRDATRPPEGKTHEASTPPGRGDLDQDALRRGEDRLEQAGGGH